MANSSLFFLRMPRGYSPFGVVLLLRQEIRGIVSRILRVRYGDFEADFENRLEAAQDRAATIEAAPVEPGQRPIEISAQDTFERLTEISPAAAILQSWAQVEVALREAARRAGINLDRGRSPLYITRVLTSTNAIDRRVSALLDDLRGLRNAVAHGEPPSEITAEDALRFRAMADTVIGRLSLVGD